MTWPLTWHHVVHNYLRFNRLPVYPGKQVQLKPFTRSVQFPLTQGLDSHSSMSVEQLKSENPGLHVQLYVPSKFRQVALFWHTCRSHSFMSVSQFFPVQPVAHVQVYAKTPSLQVAPFWHGELGQSSTFISQLWPGIEKKQNFQRTGIHPKQRAFPPTSTARWHRNCSLGLAVPPWETTRFAGNKIHLSSDSVD